MATLTLRKLCKSYAHGPEIVRGIDLDVADGEFMVLVGPSGCGKSTLLRMIAGLEDISSGSLYIGGREVNSVGPAERGIAMVFQSYALYPHMTVRHNMGFGLKLAGKPKAEIAREVERVAEVLRISHLLEHRPKALSGGERQRVAIGRAIVRQPQVFLFDEPLSNLDASLRVQMRIELSRLHRELGTTMIYVTHDQVEAMTLGQRIAVLNGGRLEQVGSPLELYRRPANLFVAGFLGTPKMNIVPAASLQQAPERAASAGIRPEHLRLADADNGIPARIDAVEHLGDMQIAYASLASHPTQLAVRLDSQATAQAGNVIHLRADAADTLWFDADGCALLAA